MRTLSFWMKRTSTLATVASQEGRFHFKLKLQSHTLDQLPRTQAHRKIFAAIKPFSAWIHAFSIDIDSANSTPN